jgi:uncharacterized repeat protein (TIGR01451 family)
MEQNSSWSIMNVRLALVMPMVVATASIGFASPAEAAGTAAGTTINNTATASYNDAGGAPRTVDSNQVSLIVDEVLDVTVASADPGDIVVQPGSTNRILSFDVTNNGNGPENYVLTSNGALGSDQFDPTPTSIVIDSNGNGVYDALTDTVYTGPGDFLLTPDQTRRVFILSSIPAGSNDADRGQAELTAAAATGTGAPGTAFTGQGQGGGDAVVGSTGADSVDNGFYLVQNATISFTKSQAVVAPASVGGGTRTVPGSIVTYTLLATVSGTGSLTNVSIADAIPANTTYEVGSMTLQAAALTDAVDADAGRTTLTGAAVTGINVDLGTVAGGQTRTVTFKVKVN